MPSPAAEIVAQLDTLQARDLDWRSGRVARDDAGRRPYGALA
jgi:hypothetical protein